MALFSRRAPPERKFIVVLDLDGILGKKDLAFDFFKHRGWENQYIDTIRKENQRLEAMQAQVRKMTAADAAPVHESYWVTPTHFASAKTRKKGPYIARGIRSVMNRYIEHRRNAGKPMHIDELRQLGRDAELMDGAAELIRWLNHHPQVKSVYINSASWKPTANEIAKRLGIPEKNVYATVVNHDAKTGRVIRVTGATNAGPYKVESLRKIFKRERLGQNSESKPLIVVGDSVTDTDMLFAGMEHGGLAIGHNPSKDLLERLWPATYTRHAGPAPGPAALAYVPEDPASSVLVASRQVHRLRALMDAFMQHPDEQNRIEGVKRIVRWNNRLTRMRPIQRVLDWLGFPRYHHAQLGPYPGLFNAIDRTRKEARQELATAIPGEAFRTK